MPKKGIHPKCQKIEIITTDGGRFSVRSCLSSKVAEYHLEIDASSHPAWTKKNRFTGPSVGNVKKFESKYPGL